MKAIDFENDFLQWLYDNPELENECLISEVDGYERLEQIFLEEYSR